MYQNNAMRRPTLLFHITYYPHNYPHIYPTVAVLLEYVSLSTENNGMLCASAIHRLSFGIRGLARSCQAGLILLTKVFALIIGSVRLQSFVSTSRNLCIGVIGVVELLG